MTAGGSLGGTLWEQLQRARARLRQMAAVSMTAWPALKRKASTRT